MICISVIRIYLFKQCRSLKKSNQFIERHCEDSSAGIGHTADDVMDAKFSADQLIDKSSPAIINNPKQRETGRDGELRRRAMA